jgi:two-component system, chemotaxis family, chemotaxis protein CheY
MRVLIVEDDFTARHMLKEILSAFGDCDVVVDGREAVQAFRLAWEEKHPYDLICMDIMMPHMDGNTALEQIREMEREIGIEGSDEVKVIMSTALGDPKTVVKAFYRGGATSYLVKPIDKRKLLGELQNLKLIA